MGLLSEAGLDELVARGCAACGGKKLLFNTFVDGKLPLLGGEPVGAIVWSYDGEKFVDGVFEVTCAACRQVVYESPICPRCHAEGGLNRALTRTNQYLVPLSCPSCGNEEVKYSAMLPVRVAYEGKRADKPRTSTEAHDPGFHGYRVDCRDCGKVAERLQCCPLCESPAPLRARPGA